MVSRSSNYTQRPRRTRSIAIIVILAVVVVSLIGTGWILASLFRSPAQVAAGAAPPPRSLITAPVTSGALAEQINVQGVIRAANEESVAVSSSEAPATVTFAPLAAGSRVSAGDVVLEVNGEPLFVVQGNFPFYRDISAGDRGRDVRQLQEGLRLAGYHLSADGVFGPDTASALEDLYRSHGYVVPMDAPIAGDANASAGASDADASTIVSGPVARASAFSVAHTLPGTLQQLPAVGALPDQATIVYSSGPLIVSASVIQGTAAQVKKGLSATATIADKQVSLTLQSIGEADKEGAIELVFTATGIPIADSDNGVQTVVTITRTVIAADSLLVPSTAVASRGDARYVLVEQAEGPFIEVPVEEVGVLHGVSAVSAVNDGALSVGDQVRVR